MPLIPMLLTLAAQAAPAPPPAATPLPDVKVTCRTERVTGSRMVKRVCRTPEQQRQADLDARTKVRMNAHSQTTPAFKPPTGQ